MKLEFTKDAVRAAGGIVHGDGNVFFTSLDQLNKAVAALDRQRAMDRAIVIDWEYETDDPLVEIDAIHADYAKSFGTYPGPEMARIVRRTRLQLFHWWAWHRDAIRAALVVADATVTPVPRVAKRLSGLFSKPPVAPHG